MSSNMIFFDPSQKIGEGQFRNVYTAHRESEPGKALVLKIFKDKCPTQLTEMKPDLWVHKRSARYAHKWNEKVASRNYGAEKIEFTVPDFARHISSGTNFRVDQLSFFEEFLPGRYEKFNSNAGYELAGHATPGAFTHWVWHKTGHNFMVCDLQGVKSGSTYRLTDPAVHSFKCAYELTKTDSGVVGMEKVLAGHRCNIICARLGLPAYQGPKRATAAAQTTYNFQMTSEELQRRNRHQPRHFKLEPLDELAEAMEGLDL